MSKTRNFPKLCYYGNDVKILAKGEMTVLRPK